MAEKDTNIHDRLVALLQALDVEERNYEAAKTEERRASKVATQALNALNEAQKAVDKAISEAKKAAPTGSDWWSSTHSAEERRT